MGSDTPTAAELIRLLRIRYKIPEWVLVEEVADGTGWSSSRRADGVAVGCWPSRGLEVHGFEVKVTRSDWLSELRAPEKAAAVAPFCHRWWIVAPSGIVKKGELPAGWGLITAKNKRMRYAVQAALREAELMPPTMLASLLRTAVQNERKAATELAYERFQEGVRIGQERTVSLVTGDEAAARHAQLLARVQRFERRTGLPLERMPYGMTRAVELILNIRHKLRPGTLDNALKQARQAVRALGQLQKALEEINDPAKEA